MKPLEVWTCQRAENLKKKLSKIPKNNYAATMVSAARRQIIGGGPPPQKKRRGGPAEYGGGRPADQQKSAAAPTNCRRRRRGAAGARLYTAFFPNIFQSPSKILPIVTFPIIFYFLYAKNF